MANSTCYQARSLTVILLLAFPCTSAYGSETLPWGVERIRAYCVWDNNRDMTVDEGANAGQYVSIAVIDFGIDYYTDGWGNIYYHPDLKDNMLGGKGFRHWGCVVEEQTDHKDEEPYPGHGTLVAGIIAAVDNTIGVIGTAPKTKIYVLKLITKHYLELAYAINYAANNLSAQIITMSLEVDGDYDEVRNAIDNAYAAGRLLLAGSGNDGGPVVYPAKYDKVIAVGAVDENLNRPPWSNYGPELDFVAPGVNINSTALDESYAIDSGTSFAVPYVTATAALIWSSKIDPEYDFDGDNAWDRDEVKAKLRHFALDLGSPGRDDEYGFGLINAWATNQRPLGDINIDYIVDMKDIYAVQLAFCSSPGYPKWNPICDINIDNHVGMKDLYTVVLNYGKTDP